MRASKPMTLEEAVCLLKGEYERAQSIEYVEKPLAYALYKVWKEELRRLYLEERRSDKNA